VWALGVILYILLSGIPPFYGDTDKEIFKMIEKGVYSLDFPQFSLVSDEALDLIKRCLVPEPKRITTQ